MEQQVRIYVHGPNGAKETLGNGSYQFDPVVLKQLIDDFISYQTNGTPRAGTYKAKAPFGTSHAATTIALRFDLVIAIG